MNYISSIQHNARIRFMFCLHVGCPPEESSSPQIRPGIHHNGHLTAYEMAISLANCPRRSQSSKNSQTSSPAHSPRQILQLGIPHIREKEKGKEAFKRHSIQPENREEEKSHID